MARIPYPDLGGADEELRSAVAAFPPLNIFRMLPQVPSLVRGFGQLGGAILGRMALDGRLRELVILRVAERSPAPYEWQQHVPIAKACGASDDEIAALAGGHAEAPCFGERERVLLRFADALLDGPRAGDAELTAMRHCFSDREVCEAIFTVGFYMMVARFLETTGVDLEVGDGADAVIMVRRLQRD